MVSDEAIGVIAYARGSRIGPWHAVERAGNAGGLERTLCGRIGPLAPDGWFDQTIMLEPGSIQCDACHRRTEDRRWRVFEARRTSNGG